MIISRLIRTRRKQLKLTQIQLARRIGVTQATISFWEGGVCIPHSAENIAALERALRLKAGTLYHKIASAA